MELAAALDSERLRDIMRAVFNRSASVVQRYQGMVDKFTGDGLMAVFGAPVALENHALRAALAAVEIQSAARALAAEVRARDNVELLLRVGLNSGEAIAGAIGVGPGGFTVVGHPVGMAQRMEAAADPGGVLCTEGTARLIEKSAVLGPPQWVSVKGIGERVRSRRLVSVESEQTILGRDEGPLIGRGGDLARLVDVFKGGRITVVGVMGEPGLGKSRLVREFAGTATAYGGDVVVTRCESHTAHVPLHALSMLLRAMFGVRGLEAEAACAHIDAELARVGEPQSGYRQALFDLLTIGRPNVEAPTMTADARRHQLVDVMGKVAQARPARTLFVVEDLHWVDAASEEVLAGFAETMRAGHSLFVGTFRPEYRGRLREMSQSTVVLAPLDRTATLTLANGLLGRRPADGGVAERIARHAVGNPFFLEETVRDLVGRGLLVGSRGNYRLVGDLKSIAVPPTVQSVLAARIDRLSSADKSVLNAAAVIGATFDLDVLESLRPGTGPDQMQGLVAAELIDLTEVLPKPRYEFRHPLVRAVAYDSQLSTTRASCHRQVAQAVAAGNPGGVDKNSALIAQHLEAAGDPADAYPWHMRAAGWLMNRDINAARDCWERARAIADALPPDEEATDKRIAPRAQLAFTEWMVGGAVASQQYVDELRELTTQSGDPLPLALALSGRLTSLIINDGRPRDAAPMASELQGLYERIDGTASERAEVLMAVAFAQYEALELSEALRTTDRLLAIGAGLTAQDIAPALAMAGAIKILTGRRAEGRRDHATARRLSRAEGDAVTFAISLGYETDTVLVGFELVDEVLLDEARNAVRMAESFGDAYGLALARWAYGMALLRTDDHERTDGIHFLHLSRSDGIDIGGSNLEADVAAESLRQGRLDDGQIAALLDAVEAEINNGDILCVGQSTAVLVRLLVVRRQPDDMDRAHDIVSQLEAQLAACSVPAFHLWPLQCRALLANAIGDETGYLEAVARYRGMAEQLDARGHLAAARQLASY
jgi:adenylate cyclase